jgi:hypothetical protein
MAKKIQGDDGKTYVQKKPFYKRVWFWALAIVVIIVVASQMNGGSDSNSSTASDKTSSSKSSSASSSSEKVPTEYKNALIKAKSYATTMDMSEAAVKDQLTSDSGEGFSQEAADYAMSHLTGIDWNKNALKKAKDYQDQQAMSPDSIKEQLVSSAGEKFTQEQADYAIQHLDD